MPTSTPPQLPFYGEENRAKIREFVDKEARRRKTVTDRADFETLVDALENVVRQYRAGMEHSGPSMPLSLRIEKYRNWIAATDVLIELETGPDLQDYAYASDIGMATKTGTPRLPLVDELKDLRALRGQELEDLERIAAGKHPYALEPRTLLLKNMLSIGHKLLGPEVGGPGGPLMRFLELVLRPVLGDDTPNGEALRQFANRIRRKASAGAA